MMTKTYLEIKIMEEQDLIPATPIQILDKLVATENVGFGVIN